MARGLARRLARVGLLPIAAIGALTLGACDATADTKPPAAAAANRPAGATPTSDPGDGATPTSDPGDGATPTSDPGDGDASGSSQALQDGTHDGYVASVDTAKRTVVFDKVEILSGEAARKAFQKENPGATDGPPNDYVLVNDNKLKRTVPVGAGVTVAVIDVTKGDGAQATPSSFAALPAFLAVRDNSTLFKLTVKDGRITAMKSIYLP